MDEYIKTRDLEELLRKLMQEPSYQHEYENFYVGVDTVRHAVMSLPKYRGELM